MTLNEFIEEQKENLEKFRKVWITGIAKTHFPFPTELEYPDWQDQFRAWLEDAWEKENEE